jgi:hypothetical protein
VPAVGRVGDVVALEPGILTGDEIVAGSSLDI